MRTGLGALPACLLTGATGRIGTACVRRLNAAGVTPHVLLRRPLPPEAWDGARVVEVPGDLEDLLASGPTPELAAALERCEVVYHLAARVNLGGRGAGQMGRLNARAAPALFALARAAGVRRFVHVSTIGTVGCSNRPVALDESAPYNLTHFRNPYFDTKRAGEQALLHAWRTVPGTTDLIVVNPSITFGPTDAFRRRARPRSAPAAPPAGAWPYRLLRFWFEGGLNLLDVRDAADGILAAGLRGEPGSRYILAGDNLTVREFLELLARVAGCPGPRYRLSPRLLRAGGALAEAWSDLTGRRARWNRTLAALAGSYWFYDASRARADLGFTARPALATIEELWQALSEAGRARGVSGREEQR